MYSTATACATFPSSATRCLPPGVTRCVLAAFASASIMACVSSRRPCERKLTRAVVADVESCLTVSGKPTFFDNVRMDESLSSERAAPNALLTLS